VTDDKTQGDVEAKLFAAALTSPIPRIYVNGFLLGQSFSDVTIVCQANGASSAILNMSFTTAKSIAFELSRIISSFEQKTNHTIMTIQDIKTKMEQ
jgi:hypothetical protein